MFDLAFSQILALWVYFLPSLLCEIGLGQYGTMMAKYPKVLQIFWHFLQLIPNSPPRKGRLELSEKAICDDETSSAADRGQAELLVDPNPTKAPTADQTGTIKGNPKCRKCDWETKPEQTSKKADWGNLNFWWHWSWFRIKLWKSSEINVYFEKTLTV